MKIITYSNKKCEQLSFIKRNVKWFGSNLEVIGLGEDNYKGHIRKFKSIYNYLLNAEEDIYVFTDAYDSLLVDNVLLLEEIIYDTLIPGTVLMSAEKACNPYPILNRLYPHSNSSFGFLNSGGWCAFREDILELFYDMNIWRFSEEENDQAIATCFYLYNKNRIVLDTNCDIFQTLYRVTFEVIYGDKCGKVYKQETKSHTIILHGNGSSDLSYAKNYFDNIEKGKRKW